jgi:hypothetical protein
VRLSGIISGQLFVRPQVRSNNNQGCIMGVGQFSCDSCGKTYAWKPQLAGKRVKCKCGSPMTVPASDPAADAGAGLDDLAALAHGGESYDDAPPPPPPPVGSRGGRPAKAGGAAVAGATCPSCGVAVDPNAVLCVNCGTNLKTGKKLKTTSVAAAPGGAAAAPAFDRPFGVKAVGDEKQMSPQAKKILAGALSLALITILTVVIIVVQNAKAKEAKRQAALNAGPKPKLERMLIAAERSGGLTQAIKEGTLAEEMSKGNPPPSAQARARYSKDSLNAMGDAVGRLGPTEEARQWLQKNPDVTFYGMTHDEALKLIDMLYDKYKAPWVQAVLKKDGDKVSEILIVTLPDMDEAHGGKADGPYRAELFKWADAFAKKLGDEQPPDVQQWYAWFHLKKAGAPGRAGALAGAAADEDAGDDASAEDEADDTPAKPANKKPKKPAPGAAKPAPPSPTPRKDNPTSDSPINPG